MIRRTGIALLVLLLLSRASVAQDALTIVDRDGRSVVLTRENMQRLPRVHVETAVRGTATTYDGVSLLEVLRLAKVDVPEPVSGPTLTAVILAAGADGYAAVLALPEGVPSHSGRTVLVADRTNGKPLADNAAPWQLVIPGDQRPTRWVRQLRRLEIRQVR